MRATPTGSRRPEDSAARPDPFAPDAADATLPAQRGLRDQARRLAHTPLPPHATQAAEWRPWLSVAKRHAPFVAILLLAAYFLTINVASPWQSIHEDNGTLNESIALNHIRYGLGVTKGQDLLDLEAKQSFGPANVTEAQHFAYFLTGPTHPQVYGDHPPLLGLTITLSFLVFGPHFWSERLVPIVYALLGLILFYALVQRLFGIGVARAASFLYATFPIMAYFGRNVSHEAPTLFWALVLLTAYVRWREGSDPTPHPSPSADGEGDQTGRPRYLVLMGIATVIGGLYGWPLYYFAVILCAVDWYARRRFDRRLALATVVPAAITFVLVIAQIAWAWGGDLSHLGSMFLHRTGGSGEQTGPISALAWFQQVTAWNAEDFGTWSQLAMPLVAAFVARRASHEGWSLRLQVVAILALWGLSHALVFRNGAYVHAYWQFYLLPVYALVIAWAAVAWARQQIPSPALRLLALGVAAFAAVNLNLATIVALYSAGYHVTLPITPLFDLWR